MREASETCKKVEIYTYLIITTTRPAFVVPVPAIHCSHVPRVSANRSGRAALPLLSRLLASDVGAVIFEIHRAGRFGYIAKYRWVPSEDVVLILAVRHQLEAGYREE